MAFFEGFHDLSYVCSVRCSTDASDASIASLTIIIIVIICLNLYLNTINSCQNNNYQPSGWERISSSAEHYRHACSQLHQLPALPIRIRINSRRFSFATSASANIDSALNEFTTGCMLQRSFLVFALQSQSLVVRLHGILFRRPKTELNVAAWTVTDSHDRCDTA